MRSRERTGAEIDLHWVRVFLLTGIMAMSSGCNYSTKPEAPANVNNSNVRPEALDSTAGVAKTRLKVNDPDRFVCDATVSLTEGGSLRFQLAKIGSDRRAVFRVPATNETVYLEHSGLRYLVLPARKQYAEVSTSDLGVDLRGLINPVGLIDRLRSRSNYEFLGIETVGYRTANRFRFTGGTDATVYVDDFSGMPFRFEVDGSYVFELSDVRMTPDSSTFDVPLGFKKVQVSDIKQQINILAAGISAFAAAVDEREQKRR